jgi:signal transduction histidine kinase
MVYYLMMYEDREGRLVRPILYLDRVSAIASAPTYSWVDSVLDHGVVGGSVLHRSDLITALARLATRVLDGESPASIPVTTVNAQKRLVDWRQLRRWQIRDVPPDTEVMFREATLWDRYQPYIIGGLSVLVGQTALLAALLIHRGRRLSAERDLRQSQERLQSSYLKIRSLNGRLLKEQETERARIARELHDDISQQMALLEIDLSRLSADVPALREQVLDDAVMRARAIGNSVHDLSHRLHPARLSLIGLVPTVHGLAREMERTGVQITVTDQHVPSVLPPDLALNVFRVVQEALQNALKYSGASRVLVHLQGDATRLHVTIEDDGTGFDVNAAWGNGLGLVSMHERLDSVGGSLRIHSAPGQHTRLEVSVPLPETSEALEAGSPASEARNSSMAGGR